MEPTSDCQVTLGAGSLAMVGKEKMAAWPAFTSKLSLPISEKVVMSRHTRFHIKKQLLPKLQYMQDFN